MPCIVRCVATLMFEQGNGVDLGRLNEAERQVLRLLAEGHTAKSVANELGSTPASVNERLREARRKTGAGSSRELARLLKSQENRHDEMGVARTIARRSKLFRTERQHQGVFKKGVGMRWLVHLVDCGSAAPRLHLRQQPLG